ncbi:MAG: hypothetical protein NXY57DRAFT_11680 [Lentinula lateritia]|nr:MAG: hypothetical protein NXY57DRAFT_11680 [Lentinula lateritia]
MEMSALGLSGTQALETNGQFSSYPVRTKVAEPVYQEPPDIRATSSRHERTSKHRHTEQSPAGTSALSGVRTRKASSTSQQAAPPVAVTPSSTTNPTNSTNPSHSSRRERDKGSKSYGIAANEPRTRHDANSINLQNPESSPSLLFQESQIANQTNQLPPTVNSSPHPSIRFTPPTPVKRSPSVLERPVVNTNYLSSSNAHAHAPVYHGGTPKAVTRAPEYTPPSVHTVQPMRETLQDRTKPSEGSRPTVGQIVTSYD